MPPTNLCNCITYLYFILFLLPLYLLRLRRFFEDIFILLANTVCFPFTILLSSCLFRKPREKPDPSYQLLPLSLFYGPPLISVAFADAVIDSSSMTLSSIHIPIQWSSPAQQHSRKDRARTRAPRRKPFLRRKLLSLFSFFAIGALPGTCQT
jgi:hypothetical protein